MTQLLAIDATQIVLIVFIALLVIAYPILISSRNKKENQKLQEQTNSLKRGDNVLTTSGVYGKVVDLHLEGDKKIVTIETGTGNHKSYMAVDAYAIYTILRDEEKKPEQSKVEGPKEEKAEGKTDKNSQKTLDVKDSQELNKNTNVTAEEVKPEIVAEAITEDSSIKDIESQISGKRKKK